MTTWKVHVDYELKNKRADELSKKTHSLTPLTQRPQCSGYFLATLLVEHDTQPLLSWQRF